jgi:hypothetical protein
MNYSVVFQLSLILPTLVKLLIVFAAVCSEKTLMWSLGRYPSLHTGPVHSIYGHISVRIRCLKHNAEYLHLGFLMWLGIPVWDVHLFGELMAASGLLEWSVRIKFVMMKMHLLRYWLIYYTQACLRETFVLKCLYYMFGSVVIYVIIFSIRYQISLSLDLCHKIVITIQNTIWNPLYPSGNLCKSYASYK